MNPATPVHMPNILVTKYLSTGQDGMGVQPMAALVYGRRMPRYGINYR